MSGQPRPLLEAGQGQSGVLAQGPPPRMLGRRGCPTPYDRCSGAVGPHRCQPEPGVRVTAPLLCSRHPSLPSLFLKPTLQRRHDGVGGTSQGEEPQPGRAGPAAPWAVAGCTGRSRLLLSLRPTYGIVIARGSGPPSPRGGSRTGQARRSTSPRAARSPSPGLCTPFTIIIDFSKYRI